MVTREDIIRIEKELSITGDVLIKCYDLNKREFYRSNGIIDLGFGINPNTNKIFFLYSKNDTREVYDKWVKNSIKLNKRK